MGALFRERGAYGRACEVEPERLAGRGVHALVLDFDGVLANHGETEPNPGCKTWLTRCIKVFGPENVYILTNKPTPARIGYFQAAFPGMRLISGVRKKPYPDGLKRACELSGVKPQSAALLDDRLMTGGLAAILAGTRFIYVSKPYIDISRRPVKELFFMAVRLAEKLFIRINCAFFC